jgi:hypothetical protein
MYACMHACMYVRMYVVIYVRMYSNLTRGSGVLIAVRSLVCFLLQT